MVGNDDKIVKFLVQLLVGHIDHTMYGKLNPTASRTTISSIKGLDLNPSIRSKRRDVYKIQSEEVERHNDLLVDHIS